MRGDRELVVSDWPAPVGGVSKLLLSHRERLWGRFGVFLDKDRHESLPLYCQPYIRPARSSFWASIRDYLSFTGIVCCRSKHLLSQEWEILPEWFESTLSRNTPFLRQTSFSGQEWDSNHSGSNPKVWNQKGSMGGGRILERFAFFQICISWR